MTPVAHVIDAGTPADMLWMLSTLRGQNEPIFSLGPVPQFGAVSDAIPLHISIGPTCINAVRLTERLPLGATLHVWSPELLKIATESARRIGGRVILSIPHLPDSQNKIKDLPWMIAQHRCTLSVPTEHARKILLSLNTDPQRVVTLPPAAAFLTDPTEINAKRNNLRKTLGVLDDEVLMVVPGDMVRFGGHKLASWSHAILRNMHKPMKMLFPGHGPFEKSVRFFANTTGFVDEVYFTGEKFSRNEIFAASDGAMFINQRQRGITALAQSMAAGLPILASATPDIAEVCTHEQTALLVKVGDPRTASAVLLQLLDDADLRAKLGREAKKFAEINFHPAKIRKKLDEIYTSAKSI